ncbi:MAG: ribulose-phosphate 3-epimerase [Bacteroidales bacterium]|nr:ribulose-phosphate 3-epimerase [Bacteroidales bacterium]
MQLQIAPSILAADFGALAKDIEMLNTAADIIHLDVMDGSFVPNISFGFPVLEAVSRVARIPMDAHFMVEHPERWAERCASLGIGMFSFHLEAAGSGSAALLQKVRSLGMKAGLVINPDIPVSMLYPYIGKADYFLLMSVFAGFGGQKFMECTYERTGMLKAEIARRGDGALIEVDGGITLENAAAVAEAGADILVAGSAVFRAADPPAVISALRNCR